MSSEQNKKIESIGLAKCELHDECDFCNDPRQGSYARMTGYDSSDVAYYICGKCALEKIRSGIENCEEISPKNTKKE